MKKAFLVNLLVLTAILVFTAVVYPYANNKGVDTAWGMIFLSTFLIGAQSITNLVLGIRRFVRGDQREGWGFLLNFLLVPAIGYPICFAIIMIEIAP